MKSLLLDIETSPNVAFVWGLWNQNIAINQLAKSGETICWAAKWLDGDEVMFSSRRKTSSKTMLKKVWKLLDEADVVIHFNGKKFDIPTLQAAFVTHGFVPPSPFQQIDLYHIVRKQFRFPSNKLDYVLQHLGLGKKVAHKGMGLWLGCMEGNAEDWEKMEEYNKGDVTELEKLYWRVLPWIHNHPNMGLYIDMDNPTCTNCGSQNLRKKGVEYTKTQRYQRYKCNDCGTNLRGRFTVVPEEDRPNILVQA